MLRLSTLFSVFRWTLWVIPVGLIVFSMSKGAIDVVQEWGKVNFFANYENGFMRRGLVGTVFHGFFGDKSEQEYLDLAVRQHHLIVGLLGLLAIAGLVFAAHRARRPFAILVGACVLAAGQVWPHLAYDVGYLDPQVLLIVALATVALVVGRPRLAAMIAGLGPLVHEQFLFYWGPIAAVQMVLLIGTPHSKRARDQEFPGFHFILLVTPMLLTTALIMLLHSDESARSAVWATPTAQDIREGLIRQHFGQTTSSALRTMSDIWGRNLDSGLLSLILYAGPAVLLSVLTMAAFPQIRNRAAIGWALFVGCFGCLAVLMLAWDLSRFATMVTVMWAGTTALIAAHATRPGVSVTSVPEQDATPSASASVSANAAASSGAIRAGRVLEVEAEHKPPSAVVAWGAMATGLAATAIGVASPFIFAYFDIYFVISGPHHLGPEPPLRPALERLMEPVWPPRPPA